MAILVLEHSDLTGSERLGEALRNYGHQLRVVRLHEGDPLPADLDDVDGVLACGGAPSPLDDSLDWLDGEMSLLREAHEAGLPIVGICLGSQILARALGGSIEPMPDGTELGWHPVTQTDVGKVDVLHAGIGWSTMQPHWHSFHVAELPPGSRLLASSDRCESQAWACGVRTYGFQYHPEIGADTMERWVADEPDALDRVGTTLEALREATEQHYPTFERLSARLFDQIAMLLMPLDRRYDGQLKDLHH